MNLDDKLKSIDLSLYSCLGEIKKFCSDAWKDNLLPWFTNHDCEHSVEIIHILGQILKPLENTIHFPNKHELFILLASAYMHDVGMQFLKIDRKTIETLTEIEYNHIRKEHAEQSHNIILKSVKSLERDDFHPPVCIDEEYVPIIALISKGHSTNYFDEICNAFNHDPRYTKGEKVRGELLTALLMIADELDLLCKRVKFSETAKFNLSVYSQIHWFKHHYVEYVSIKNGVINIILRFPEEADSYKELIRELIETKLIKQINKINPILLESTSNSFHLDQKIHFENKIEKTGVKRKLPDNVLLELTQMLRKSKPDDSQTATLARTATTFPKPSLIFTGMDSELKRFEIVYKTSNFISIEGLGGIGKTQLAAKCIEDYIPRDNIVWFDCLPDSKLDTLIELSGYPDVIKGENKTERAKYSGYRDLIERDNKIIFLDNFQDVTDPSFNEFFKISENYLRKAKIILISREHPNVSVKVAPVEIKGLKGDAFTYATKLIKTYYPDIIITENELKEICDNVEGHPLAIDLSLQLISYGESSKEIIKKIVSSPDKSTELSRRLLDEIFNHPKSTDDEKNLILNFSVFRYEVDTKAISNIINLKDIDKTLHSLYNKKMLTRTGTLLGTHPLIKEFCYQKLTNEKDVHLKAAKYFNTQRRNKFDPLMEDEIFYHLFTGGFFEMAADLISEKGERFILSGHTNFLIAAIEKIVAHGIDKPEFNLFYGDISTVRGEWDKAIGYYEKAFLSPIVNEKIMAEAYIKCGEIFYRKGEVKESQKYFENAFETCKNKGYKKEQARSLNDIGLVYEKMGNLTLAESKLNEALQIRKSIGDKKGLADTLNNLGNISCTKGNYAEGLHKYNNSIVISKLISDNDGLALYLNNIAFILANIGKFSEAMEKAEESLIISNTIGAKPAVARSLYIIGNIHCSMGNQKVGLAKSRESLKIFREIGSKEGIASANLRIGKFFQTKRKFDTALAQYSKSLNISKEIGHKQGVAMAIAHIADLLNNMGSFKESLEKYNEALKIYEEISSKSGIRAVINNIGNALSNMGKLKEAFEKYNEGLKISKEIGDKYGIAVGYYNLGVVYLRENNYSSSLDNFLKSFALNSQMQTPTDNILKYITEIKHILGVQKFNERLNECWNNLDSDFKPHVNIESFVKSKTIHYETPTIGRNDPCTCGSGKKYKKCCGRNV